MTHPSADRDEAAAHLPQAAERRAFIRYPRRLDMLWQLLGVADRPLGQARIFDVSASGLGLIVDRPLAPGTRLFVRLPTATRGWNSFLVLVKHCKPSGANEFQAGCAFPKPLTPEELHDLLI